MRPAEALAKIREETNKARLFFRGNNQHAWESSALEVAESRLALAEALARIVDQEDGRFEGGWLAPRSIAERALRRAAGEEP